MCCNVSQWKHNGLHLLTWNRIELDATLAYTAFPVSYSFYSFLFMRIQHDFFEVAPEIFNPT